MRCLDLDGNHLEEKGLMAVLSCMSNVQAINFGKSLDENLSDKAVSALYDMIKSLDKEEKVNCNNFKITAA